MKITNILINIFKLTMNEKLEVKLEKKIFFESISQKYCVFYFEFVCSAPDLKFNK
jgi:hypothetical protein